MDGQEVEASTKCDFPLLQSPRTCRNSHVGLLHFFLQSCNQFHKFVIGTANLEFIAQSLTALRRQLVLCNI
jgi:hypothetical protein